MIRYLFIYTIMVCSAFMLVSCSQDSPAGNDLTETVLFEKSGLVDSAVVTGCYAYTLRYFVPETILTADYNRLRAEFDGFSTSDVSTISLIYNTVDSSNVFAYEVSNLDLNGFHSFNIAKSAGNMWFELRLYLNPQVCGTNEFRYTRVRDLWIYGIK